jgi:uncharacterized protein YqgC (DUF456 family)
MDVLLILLGLVAIFTGMLGSFLPVLPGPPLAWLGLFLIYLTDAVPVNFWVLGGTGMIAALMAVADYAIPAHGAKKFGASRFGVWGTNIGLVVGLFLPIPFGFVIGAFAGAIIGEYLHDASNHKKALNAAAGSFLGFLVSAFMQFLTCLCFLGIFMVVAIRNWSALF